MKIVAVNFKNINSLKGEHQIDFNGDEFSQNPLFAITGPTGSGKTTILDVISLALFGEIPRLGRISNRVIEEQGAVLTRNQEEAFAKVTYECKSGRFDSVWSISTARTGNLRDYEMELTKLDPLKRLDLKKSEVPGRNEELIGLNYSQFIKSVVLAQGEFSKFLKAPKKERSELLEQITGTGIYRQLGILAYRKFADKNKNIETAEKILEAEQKELLPKEEKETKNKELEKLKSVLDDLSKKDKKLQQQIELYIDLKELEKSIANRTEAIDLQSKERDKFETQYGKIIADHEIVQGFSAEIQDWKNQQQQLKDLKSNLNKLITQKSVYEGEKHSLLEAVENFIHKGVNDDNILSELSDFYEKVNHLQNRRKELLNQYNSQLKAFEREILALNLAHSAEDYSKHPEAWYKLIEKIKSDFEKVHQYFRGEIPENFETLVEKLKAKSQLLQNAQKDQQYIADLKTELSKSAQHLEQVEETVEKHPQIIEKLNHQVELGEKEIDNLELRQKNQLMIAQVEDLRQQLKAGEPCMLCGSTTHPYLEHLPEQETDLSVKIKAAKDRLTTDRARLSEYKTILKKALEQKGELTKEIDTKNSSLLKRMAQFKTDYELVASIEEDRWKDKIDAVNKEIEKLKRFKEVREKHDLIVLQAAPAFEELIRIRKAGKKSAEDIKLYYKGDNLLKDYQDLQSKWEKVVQNLDFVRAQQSDNQEKYDKLHINFKAFETELSNQLLDSGFSKIEEAQNALLSASVYQSYKEKREKLKDTLTGLKADLKSRIEHKNKLSERLETEIGLEQLTKEQDVVKKEIEEKAKQKEEVQRILKNDEDRLQRIKTQTESIKGQQQENRRWKLLNGLIGDAQGTKFNQFAQDLTLRHLLKLANQRLKHISGRYLLVIKQNAKDKDDNLLVSDLDMGGQERAVQTLSGGETFLMSLALALALSDLASKNVQINSLFIDEGFGTLDPETLDQTLDTLERLQASSNKTIGIISHVESLKERIATQIQLERDGQGYSTLKVVTN